MHRTWPLLRLGKRRFAASIAIGGTATIAVLDEFRQSFTPGRTMSAQDVLVDTAGAIVFVSLVVAVRKILKKKKRHNYSLLSFILKLKPPKIEGLRYFIQVSSCFSKTRWEAILSVSVSAITYFTFG